MEVSKQRSASFKQDLSRTPTLQTSLPMSTKSAMRLLKEGNGSDTGSVSKGSSSDGLSEFRSVQLQESLNFGRVGLIGREQETLCLARAFDGFFDDAQMMTSATGAERVLALISGPSGSGKSALAMSLDRLCHERFAFFVTGRFHLHQMEEPYSGIKQALSQLCESIQNLPTNDAIGAGPADSHRLSTLRKQLLQGLAPEELQILSAIVPGIQHVLSNNGDTLIRQHQQASSTSMSHSSAAEAPPPNTVSYREMSDRLKFVLRRFLQIVCKCCPILMVIDDIEYADKASLDLIQSWMLDSAIKSLMIVATLRSDLSESSQTIKDMAVALEDSKRGRRVDIVPIPLGDLSIKHVKTILIELLSPDQDEDVNGLADVVYKKTGGNAYFVQQLLESLVQDGLLAFDEDLMKWTFDEGVIQEESSATSNTIELLKHKLEQCNAARYILPIAACLGPTFSRSRLIISIRAMAIHSNHSTFFGELFGLKASSPLTSELYIRKSLKLCEREGFIEACHQRQQTTTAAKRTGSHTRKGKTADGKGSEATTKFGSYRFIHNKVQEAAFAIIPEQKLGELQFRVGEVLLSGLSTKDLDEDAFSVVNLINSRLDLVPDSSQSTRRRMRIAMLNCTAGSQAVQCSAFHPALRYFQNAMKLLPKDHWTSHFRKSIDIFSSAAECAFITGDTEQMHSYCSAIIALDCSVLHKIRARHIMIDECVGNFVRNKESNGVDMCLDLLAELGCKFPKSSISRSFATIQGFMHLKRLSSKWTLQTFQDLKFVTDPTESAITKTLDKMSNIAYLSTPDLVPLILQKSIYRTLKNGISIYSPPSFAFVGMIFGCFMKDLDTGRKFGEIALHLQSNLGNNTAKSRTLFLNAITKHWSNPTEEGYGAFLEGYRSGMASGDVEGAMWCMLHCMQIDFFLGKPLGPLDGEMSIHTTSMSDFRQHNHEAFLRANHQALQNLRGLSNHRTKLIGDAFDEREYMDRPANERDQISIFSITFNRLLLATYLGDFDVGAKVVVETQVERLKKLPGSFAEAITLFWGGVCCYAMASSTANNTDHSTNMPHISSKWIKKYKGFAIGNRKKLKDIRRRGNPNCDHYIAFLNAENDLLHKRTDSAARYYLEAIELSRQRGCIHDQALANERLAMCMLERLDDKETALIYFRESIRLNEEWGAAMKVQSLKRKMSQMRR